MQFDQMKRREFISLLGGAAAAWPLAARTQQTERMRRIGVFMRLSQSDPVTKGYLAALAQGLAPLGWSQSRNLQLIFRISGGDPTANAAAADLVRQSPEVILSHGTETSRIVQQHTSAIPIVFTTVTDPVGSGLVESLARPGGNTTGFTNFEFSMAGKWLELLKEVAPAVKNIAILFNPDNAAMPGQLRAIAFAAPALGLQVTEAKVRDRGDIERAINALAQTPNAGFIVLPENLVITNRELIVAWLHITDCRRSFRTASILRAEACCPMAPTPTICIAARLPTSTISCAAKSRPIYRSSNPQSSNSSLT